MHVYECDEFKSWRTDAPDTWPHCKLCHKKIELHHRYGVLDVPGNVLTMICRPCVVRLKSGALGITKLPPIPLAST